MIAWSGGSYAGGLFFLVGLAAIGLCAALALTVRRL
jgi:hypothetical protein